MDKSGKKREDSYKKEFLKFSPLNIKDNQKCPSKIDSCIKN